MHKIFYKKASSYLWLIGILSLFPVSYAHAYLDPGTGSYALQILIGVLFGAGYIIKMFWSKIINFFKPAKKREAKNGSKE